MRRLRLFLSWSPGARRLWLSALLLAASARLGLWLLPVRTLRGVLRRLARVAPPVRDPTPRRVASAVASASRYVPRATCLTRALAAEALLLGHGYPVRLCIGVTREGENGLGAHAWVEDAVTSAVVDETDRAGYERILVFDGPGS